MIAIVRFILKDAKSLKYDLAVHGFTERSYAQHISITGSYLSQILHGKRRPGASTARRIAKGIGKAIPDIFLVEMRPKIQQKR